jgi:inhibitor of cysteine peptidase
MRTRAVTIVLIVVTAGALAAVVGACGDKTQPTPTMDAAPKTSTSPTGTGTTLTFTKADNGSTIPGKVGDLVALRLDENPTTGYQWKMTASAGLTAISSEYEGPTESPAPVGAGGVHVWSYQLQQTGTQTLDGQYLGPDGTTIGDEFKLTISVE